MFKRTLIALTIQYSVLLLLLFGLFSVGIYVYMEHNFGGDYVQHANSPTKVQVSEAADVSLDRLRSGLLLSYGGVLVVVPAVSFILARRALRPVEESFELQQQFVDDASHELRTPLSIIQGELELAASKPRSNKQYLAAITMSLEETRTLTTLVTSLLLLARNDQDKLGQSFQSISLRSLVTKTVRGVSKAYPDRSYSFDGSSTKITGSPELVERAIANVLENAAKFSAPGGAVSVVLGENKGLVEVAITDNGIGMTSQDLARVYDRFWRGDKTRTIKGHGLGLPLVQQIMAVHGGSVKISSQINSGTSVTLQFPQSSLSR